MIPAVVGLGSNLGDRGQILRTAAARLRQLPQSRLVRISRWYATRPIGGPPGQPSFLNAAAVLETELPPLALLAQLQAIEHDAGRNRLHRWEPRTLDLDLLLYGGYQVADPRLTVPHPWLVCRRFALAPAAEVCGSLVHPACGLTLAQLLRHLDESAALLAVTGPPGDFIPQVAEQLAACLPARCAAWSAAGLPADGSSADRLSSGELAAAAARLAEPLARESWPVAAWTVSDYWFGGLPAYSAGWAPAAQQAWLAAWAAEQPRVVPPRLIAVILPDRPGLEPPLRWLARLTTLLRQAEAGPSLVLRARAPDAAVEDLQAAVAAMEPLAADGGPLDHAPN